MLHFDKPVFIIAAPRSGSTLLYEALCKHPDFVSVRGESHSIIEGIPELSIVANGFKSNQLSESDLTPEIKTKLHARFAAHCESHDGRPIVSKGQSVRFLEKTPKNILRIPFLRALYPDAKFVYLFREPLGNISSIMDAWRSGRFVTYPGLPRWGRDWSLLLPPNWESLKGASIAKVATFQWGTAHVEAMKAFEAIPGESVFITDYEQLLASPVETCNQIFEFSGLRRFSVLLEGTTLPESRYTLSKPSQNKWHNNADALADCLEDISEYSKQINQFLSDRTPYRLPLSYTVPKPERTTHNDNHDSIRSRLSRNSPCFCGSGKRFKQCHGRLS